MLIAAPACEEFTKARITVPAGIGFAIFFPDQLQRQMLMCLELVLYGAKVNGGVYGWAWLEAEPGTKARSAVDHRSPPAAANRGRRWLFRDSDERLPERWHNCERSDPGVNRGQIADRALSLIRRMGFFFAGKF